MNFRRTCTGLYAIALLGCILAHAPAWASTGTSAQKSYSPFDEAQSRIPKAMIGDVRLDRKVKVFCKSRNVKDMFSDISAKTGIRITANSSIAGQRVILYFHNRPLRDVMTEVANTLGLYWMVTGKEGSYSYELIEDLAHRNRRYQVQKEIDDYKNGILADFTSALASGGLDSDKARSRGLDAKMSAPANKALLSLMNRFGSDSMASLFGGMNPVLRYADMPADAQLSSLMTL